ncbi:MAG: FHA domain-containing protein [Isosphaeraceae bacterium]|nr:FHA domain-containing protein [Isosphaeraceae bacterium]
MKAELVPDNGDPPIPITKDITVVGRREFCDIVINDASLSKRHCVLVKTDGLIVIRDLASTNGTKVKGQRIRWAALLPDDRIAFGSYKLRLYLGADDAPSPSELPRGRAQVPVAQRPGVSPGNSATQRPTPKQDDYWDEDDGDSGWRAAAESPPLAILDDDDEIIELE